MTSTDDLLFEQTAAVIREHFRLDGATPITRDTTMTDVAGWDSLSYTMLVIALEKRFGVELLAEYVFEARTVAALVALIAQARQ